MARLMGPAGSLWEQTAAIDFEGETLSGDVRCDVVVIGAGFTGLRAALELAEAGTSVVVLDAEHVGFGASGRNGGQVNPLLPVSRPEQLRAAVGPKYFERMAHVSLGSADELFALVRKYEIDCDARQNGWLRVDHCTSAMRDSRSAAESWREFGHSYEPIDGKDVEAITGSPIYKSAILVPKGGAVQPMSLVRGLARAASKAGAKIFDNARVTEMQKSGSKWTVSVSAHRVEADWVILATNGYSGDATPALRRSILPLIPIQLSTDPLPKDVIDRILPQGQTIADTRRIIMYSRREPDDRVVYGGMGYRLPGGKIGGIRWLERDAVRVFPALRGINLSHRWGGQIALTEDRVPHFHEPEPGMIAGLGYNGRGVAMSLVMGRVLAERALGAAPEALPFPVIAMKKYAFRDVQEMGSGIAMGWMKMLDSFESRFAS